MGTQRPEEASSDLSDLCFTDLSRLSALVWSSKLVGDHDNAALDDRRSQPVGVAGRSRPSLGDDNVLILNESSQNNCSRRRPSRVVWEALG